MVTAYLDPEETFNLKHSDRSLFYHIDNNLTIQKQILFSTVQRKNKSIEEMVRRDNLDLSLNNDYLNKNVPIDSLMTKYNPLYEERNPNSERNRKELGNTIFKAIDYINDEVGYFMNMNGVKNNYSSPTVINSTNPKKNNLLGSFGGYMNKFVNNILSPVNDPTQTSSQKNYHQYNSTGSTKINTESKENSVISTIEGQFLNFDKKENNFPYTSPLEIKNLLFACFFRLGELNNHTSLKSFVEEVTSIYAKLLFFSIEIMKELCETRVVKNSLYEFVNNIKEEKRLLMKDNNQLMREINSLAYINSLIKDQRDELRDDLEEINEENKNLKLNNDVLLLECKKIKEKYQKLENDYFEVKCFYKKENTNLLADLEMIIKERDTTVEMLKNIKNFFNK